LLEKEEFLKSLVKFFDKRKLKNSTNQSVNSQLTSNITYPRDYYINSTTNVVEGAEALDLLAHTDAGKHFFTKTRRKRWANAVQRDKFEQAEAEVGSARMKEAVDWALVSGISNIKAIISAARNGKRAKKNGRVTKPTVSNEEFAKSWDVNSMVGKNKADEG
jgi:hypothetical protein